MTQSCQPKVNQVMRSDTVPQLMSDRAGTGALPCSNYVSLLISPASHPTPAAREIVGSLRAGARSDSCTPGPGSGKVCGERVPCQRAPCQRTRGRSLSLGASHSPAAPSTSGIQGASGEVKGQVPRGPPEPEEPSVGPLPTRASLGGAWRQRFKLPVQGRQHGRGRPQGGATTWNTC